MDVKPLLRLLRGARGGDRGARDELRRLWAYAETLELGERSTRSRIGERLAGLADPVPQRGSRTGDEEEA